MNTFLLSIKNILAKPLSSLLSVLLFGFGVAMIVIILLTNTALKQEINKNAGKVDLVVGAKGSPLQIILATIFQIDFPTGNISLEDAHKLSKNRLIKETIPISMGDSFKGYRIVGTTKAYADHYQAQLASGKWFDREMTATLGAEIAQKLHLKVGDKIISEHGLAAGGDSHEEDPITIVGIMKPTGTVIDRLALIPLASVWHVHEHGDEEEHTKHVENGKDAHEETSHHEDEHHEEYDTHHGDEEEHKKENHHHEKEDEHEDKHLHEGEDKHEHEDKHHHEGHKDEHHDDHEATHEDEHDHEGEHHHEHHDHEAHGHHHEEENLIPLKKLGINVTEEQLEENEITAMLVKYRSPMAAVQLPRAINKTSNLQAASPAYETARLFNIISIGIDIVKIVAGLIMLLSAISVFIALINSLKERKYELAILRSMGASRIKVFSLILVEGVVLAALGCILGLFIAHITYLVISKSILGIQSNGALFVTDEWYIIAGAIIVGIFAAIIPAAMAYKSDISKILSKA